MNKLFLAFLALIVLALAPACGSLSSSSGATIEEMLIPGQTTWKEVYSQLGSPSGVDKAQSIDYGDVWRYSFYVNKTKYEMLFGRPLESTQEAYRLFIYFDGRGIVHSYKIK
jgi:hypothetical protein